jgi:hypothetical protein
MKVCALINVHLNRTVERLRGCCPDEGAIGLSPGLNGAKLRNV